MARRRQEKPVEELRTVSRSTADLEETLAGMFAPAPRDFSALPPKIDVVESTPVNTAPPAVSPTVSAPVETIPVESPRVDSAGVDASPVDLAVGTALEHTPVKTVGADFTPVVERQIVSTPVESNNPVFTGFDTGALFLARVKKRLFQPSYPAQAHTDGEDRLYRFMWQEGREHSPLVRVYAGSMARLARAMGRDERNTRPLVEALIRKLAIQIARDQNFSSKDPRVYYVFDEAEVAARRRQAGLVWAVKNKGIQLIGDDEAQRLIREQYVAEERVIDTTDLTPVKTVLQR